MKDYALESGKQFMYSMSYRIMSGDIQTDNDWRNNQQIRGCIPTVFASRNHQLINCM